jgi:RNA polymerase sigma-70 factor (ECF subfamily)
MAERDGLAGRFEEQRPHLRAVAYRMLGSLSDADDAVQETWLRLSQADSDDVENLRAWLTTIVARVSLNMLRARKSRREEPIETHVPDPVVSFADGADPEQQALLADSIGLALQVALETLAPAERLAFVLHDVFAVPFEEIAPLVDRSPAAARQLASRARRQIRGQAPVPDRDLTGQREVVDAFFAAAHDGDVSRLVAVLDPEVVLRTDRGTRHCGASAVIRGAGAVVARALAFSRLSPHAKPALVNGAAGVVVVLRGRPFSVMGFTVVGSRIVEIDVLADPERLRHIELAVLGHSPACRGETR